MIKKIKFEFNDDSEMELIHSDDGWISKEEIEKSIQNAKKALEEAFTPHIKELLANKLRDNNE